MEINLTKCQQRAIDAVLESRKHITISGPAGSGKSFLTKHLISVLGDRLGIALCAPTHGAKLVLSKMAGINATTIHSLFKIHPETYEDVKVFNQSKAPDLSKIRYLLIDEGSMIDDDLLEIVMNCIPHSCQVIVIGDKHQVQPVRHEPGRISSVFTDPRFRLVELTEIVRQKADNPIIEVATGIRQGGWFKSNWNREQKCGVLHVSSITKVMEKILSKVNCPEDLLDYRLLAYTNKVVDKMNSVVRRHVYNTDQPYIDNEYLIMQQPVSRETEIGGETQVEIIINNGEIVKIKSGSIRPFTMQIDLPLVESFDVEAANMTVITDDELNPGAFDGAEYDITVVWDAESQAALNSALASAAAQYRSLSVRKKKGEKGNWDYFWDIKGRFAETKTLGASTIHKCQGTTVKGCGIYTGDMNGATEDIQTQLAYVACTRATDWVLFC